MRTAMLICYLNNKILPLYRYFVYNYLKLTIAVKVRDVAHGSLVVLFIVFILLGSYLSPDLHVIMFNFDVFRCYQPYELSFLFCNIKTCKNFGGRSINLNSKTKKMGGRVSDFDDYSNCKGSRREGGPGHTVGPRS